MSIFKLRQIFKDKIKELPKPEPKPEPENLYWFCIWKGQRISDRLCFINMEKGKCGGCDAPEKNIQL